MTRPARARALGLALTREKVAMFVLRGRDGTEMFRTARELDSYLDEAERDRADRVESGRAIAEEVDRRRGRR